MRSNVDKILIKLKMASGDLVIFDEDVNKLNWGSAIAAMIYFDFEGWDLSNRTVKELHKLRNNAEWEDDMSLPQGSSPIPMDNLKRAIALVNRELKHWNVFINNKNQLVADNT